MAGRGQRFVDAGYEKPKMLIEAKGKTLLEWSVDSLPLELSSKLIFILLKDHDDDYNLVEIISSKYGNHSIEFVVLDEVTRGQAETVLKAKHLWDLETDLVIFNIDTFFYSPSLKVQFQRKTDGILGCFLDKSDSKRFSYAKTNEDSVVIEVAEKVHISNNALTGLYHFKNANDFIRVAQKHLNENQTVQGEFYIAPMYNDLIKEGKQFKLDLCEDYAILGTPKELETFLLTYIY